MKVDFKKLDRAFNPRCVVVVGDKDRFRWLKGQSTFKGKLYSVQVNPETIKEIEALGYKNYTSLLDVPDPIDLVIVAVPRAIAPRILEDCIQREVAAVHFFTAGFTETETEDGAEQERLLAERAKQANLHLIGPNCMGIFNPEVGIRQSEQQYTGITGPVGLISQSGTNAITFSREGHIHGVNIKKSVSFGNGVVLDSPDFLEYFGRDPEIEVIGMYLEGVKDGRRFLTVLKEVAVRKPVVIWKGGRTAEGERAIASHTGSLAVSPAIWDAVVRQNGAISVENMAELVDTLKALLHLAPVRSSRVGVIGWSGGLSVAIADVFAEAGLELPRLTRQSYEELASFWTLIGGGYGNPIDTGNANRSEMRRIVEILERDTNIDSLAMVMVTGVDHIIPEELQSYIDAMVSARKRNTKSVLAILSWAFSPSEVREARDMINGFQSGGVPAFISLERGARALMNALKYYRFKDNTNQNSIR